MPCGNHGELRGKDRKSRNRKGAFCPSPQSQSCTLRPWCSRTIKTYPQGEWIRSPYTSGSTRPFVPTCWAQHIWWSMHTPFLLPTHPRVAIGIWAASSVYQARSVQTYPKVGFGIRVRWLTTAGLRVGVFCCFPALRPFGCRATILCARPCYSLALRPLLLFQ